MRIESSGETTPPSNLKGEEAREAVQKDILEIQAFLEELARHPGDASQDLLQALQEKINDLNKDAKKLDLLDVSPAFKKFLADFNTHAQDALWRLASKQDDIHQFIADMGFADGLLQGCLISQQHPEWSAKDIKPFVAAANLRYLAEVLVSDDSSKSSVISYIDSVKRDLARLINTLSPAQKEAFKLVQEKFDLIVHAKGPLPEEVKQDFLEACRAFEKSLPR